MKCKECGRDGLSQKELAIHMKYYHKKQMVSCEQPQKIAAGMCPDCGSTLFYQEGCTTCPSCGYSRCG